MCTPQQGEPCQDYLFYKKFKCYCLQQSMHLATTSYTEVHLNHKKTKQINQLNIISLKNLSWWEADQLAVYKHD